MAAALTLGLTYTSCDELAEDLEETEKEAQKDDDASKVSPKAYLPIAYADKTVAAWYMLTDQEENKTRFEAVFLFEDSTLVVTKAKYYTDGRDPEYAINATGRYSLKEGDFTNGKAIGYTSDGKTFNVEIKDCKLTTEQGEEVYIKMSNDLIPKAIEVIKGGDNGDNNGDNKQLNELLAYLSDEYGEKEIGAWYLDINNADQEFEQEAIFLFKDMSAVVMELKVFGEATGMQPEFYVKFKGSYEITQGDYQNGTFKFTSTEMNFDATVREGKLAVFNRAYTRQAYGDYKPDNGGDDNQGGDNKPDGGNDKPQGGDDNQQGGVDAGMAYLPIAYANVPVEAWYSSTTGVEQVSKTVAVFFFTDKRMVMTDIEVYSNGNSPYCTILMEGSYELQKQSDFENGGSVKIITNNGRSTEASVNKGQLTLNGETFTKQDNSKLPDPYDPNGGNDKPNGGDDGGNDKPDGEGGDGNDKPDGGDDNGGADNQGGDDESGSVQYNGDAVPYLPSDYADKTIAAWYMLTDKESQSIRIEAVFLFTDNTLVVTKNKVYSTADGRDPEKKPIASGTYELVGRSIYTQGTANVTLSDGSTMEVAINNGVLTAMNEEFTKQDNSTAPQPTK